MSVLGLDQEGRLTVAELKWGKAAGRRRRCDQGGGAGQPDLAGRLAGHLARFHSLHQSVMSKDEAYAELHAHAPDLSQDSLRRPRIVLLAKDFSPALMSSVVWLSEMGLDIRLVQISAFRSYAQGVGGGANQPMISVKQVYPLAEVEEFSISPERQLAREAAESKKRVQDASTVSRLVCTDSVAEGTIFTLHRGVTSARTCGPGSRTGCTRTPSGARPRGRTTRARRWSGTPTAPPTRPPRWCATSSRKRPVSAGTSSARNGGATLPGGRWSSWRAR